MKTPEQCNSTMKRFPTNRSSSVRFGVAHILIVVMLFTFIVTAALTVDVAYMYLIRTELRVATDAAAIAGAEALSRTENQAEARRVARQYAQLNTVAGQPFRINDKDIHFGRAIPGQEGTWEFDAAGVPGNAVRVVGNIGNGGATSAIPLFFGPALGHSDFNTSHSVVAAQQNVNVCLCLDRSGSMAFDMTGTVWSYPPNNPNLAKHIPFGPFWQNYMSPPHPVESRWAILANAVNLFLDEVSSHSPQPRTALVTWGSAYRMPFRPRTYYPEVEVDYDMPSISHHDWDTNSSAIRKAIERRSDEPLMGGTNLSAGLDKAVNIMTKPGSSVLSTKIIILLTDGFWNGGRNPILAAQDAADAGITVHTVSLLGTPSVTKLMQDIADITGGNSHTAQNETQLRGAFFELANALPVALIE